MAIRSAKNSRQALAFVFLTVTLDSTGLGIIIPVIPQLIMDLTGEGVGAAAVYGGWLLFLYAAMQFFCAPLMGNLSDRFGRRVVLLLSLLAFGLDYVLMGFAPNVGWLFVGRTIAGICGATHTTANAYVADVSPPTERAQNFGLLGAAWGLGFIIGPVLGGLLGSVGSRVPFFSAAGLALLNLCYGFVVLPETLARDKRRAFAWRRANPLGAVLHMRRYPIVLGLIAALLLYQIAHDANPSTWSYYTMKKFGWGQRDIGYSLGFVGVMIALVQGGLIRRVVPRVGEEHAVHLGLSGAALGFIGFAFASAGWMMYAFIVPFCMGGLAIPALRGIMSKNVSEDEQGELQGATTSMVSLTAIVAPLFMTQLFGFFTRPSAPVQFPGVAFFAAALLVVGSVATFRLTMRRARGKK